ncbi:MULTISPECIES: type IV pilin N-terminal domain-containing protein [unclassified Methanoculleus]|jgi:flagellin-like protein|uniref:type IV pilin N-terminal domain-containing protein n=3 Tax=Methanoculleus TaxID=45989 RepID=UPI00319DABE5
MLNFKQNEEAVSPVIGTILMVAITVILAAVIAAFVFGMSGNMGTTKTVAATASQNGDDIVVNYKGGADASTLNYLKITVGDDLSTQYCYVSNTSPFKVKKETSLTDLNLTALLPVGETVVFVDNGTTSRDHVLAVGYFLDGTEQVVLDTYV